MELELRLLILLAGLLVIALIYAWGMRHRIRERLRRRHKSRDFNAPVLDDMDTFNNDSTHNTVREDLTGDAISLNLDLPPEPRNTDAEEVDETHQTVATEQAADPSGEEKLAQTKSDQPPSTEEKASVVNVVLLVLAPQSNPFQGPKLNAVFQDLGYHLSHRDTWDFQSDGGKAVFSVGHLLEPGTFSMATIEHLSTPGLVLYMHLPGPLAAVAAVELLLDSAVQLAERLGGSVCNERGTPMTLQLQDNLRQEAAEFEQAE